MMRNKRGVLMMSIGLLLLAGAIGLTSYNIITEKMAETRSDQTVTILQEQIPDYQNSNSQSDQLSDQSEATVTEMQAMDIDEHDYIGVLDIPVIDISLPVQQDWSYPALNYSPCRYRGSFLNDSMIIAGHNYQEHFGKLYQLRNGDIVKFTDVAGNVYRYAVASVETLAKTDVEEMESGNWDLTLFTCTPGGTNRVTVRCKRI
ncbi:sortase [Acetobacterium paludosum]|uniref:Sortase n=1 Tax=Acetobacterium paludosum TaxID=52693 RepID=A0A923HQX6_9FIRM|nr:sortase [Acetobacterium paludosum]MBC3886756.1 sortase [Acetobacterium paludosum]